MKWLLLITLSLYSFIVQSAPCALTNVGEQRGTYILKPLSMKGNLTAEKIENISFFDESDFSAPPASGSFFFDAMAVIPCSMKTLGKIANSIADNLVVRAAEVALKERRTLVVVPRETPLALTHLRNMCSLSEAGASILPACPAFYQKPKSVADIADFIAARAAMAMGFKQNIFKEWGYEEKL